MTLRDDWWELRNRLEKLVIKLERAGFISREDLRGKVDSSFYYFKQRKRDARAYIKDALSGFRMVDDNDAKKIIELYHLLHGALEKMKKKQYQKQIAGKQAYLVGLKTRENLSMRVLQESSSSGIQAFLLTKTS